MVEILPGSPKASKGSCGVVLLLPFPTVPFVPTLPLRTTVYTGFPLLKIQTASLVSAAWLGCGPLLRNWGTSDKASLQRRKDRKGFLCLYLDAHQVAVQIWKRIWTPISRKEIVTLCHGRLSCPFLFWNWLQDVFRSWPRSGPRPVFWGALP